MGNDGIWLEGNDMAHVNYKKRQYDESCWLDSRRPVARRAIIIDRHVDSNITGERDID